MNETNQRGGALSHIAVIMDGNGRWARRRRLPRSEGHRQGLAAAKRLVREVAATPASHLTLFAFSSENWQRPAGEVRALLSLFAGALAEARDTFRRENDGVRLRFIGDESRLPAALRRQMRALENATQNGDNLTLTLAIGYSGRWDIAQAAQKMAASGAPASEENFARHLATAGMPPPDLLIRTGGERRISNFMLWQTAYSELYFTDTLWPDFAGDDLRAAVADFVRRERRFGRVADAADAGEEEWADKEYRRA